MERFDFTNLNSWMLKNKTNDVHKAGLNLATNSHKFNARG